ncbi:DNA-binding protein HU [compost metagenome]
MAKGWTKTDLVNHLVTTNGISKAEAERQIANVLGGIEHGVVTAGSVQLIGHGTYEKRERAARKGRNPQTGEEIQIDASVKCGFKTGKAFEEKLA